MDVANCFLLIIILGLVITCVVKNNKEGMVVVGGGRGRKFGVNADTINQEMGGR